MVDISGPAIYQCIRLGDLQVPLAPVSILNHAGLLELKQSNRRKRVEDALLKVVSHILPHM